MVINMRKILFICFVLLLITSVIIADTIIIENFQSWTSRGSYGDYTQADTYGTWTMTQCIVAPTGSASGIGSKGYVQLKGTSGILELPVVNSCGMFTVYIRAGGSNRTIKLQKKIGVGGSWTDVITFDAIGTTTVEKSVEINESSSEVYLRLVSPSSTIYAYDIFVTNYSSGSQPPEKPAFIQPTNNITYSTSAVSITVSGTTPINTNLRLYLNNILVYEDNDLNENWSTIIKIDSGLIVNDTNTIAITAEASSLFSETNTMYIFVDTAAPVPVNNNLVTETLFSEKRPTFNFVEFIDSSGIETYNIYIADNENFINSQITTTNTNQNFTVDFDFTNGVWYIKIIVIDGVGNSSAEYIDSFTIQLPSITIPRIIKPTEEATYNTSAIELTLEGEIDSGALIIIRLNNVIVYSDTINNTIWTYQISNLLANETNKIEINAAKTGLYSDTRELEIYIDTQIPVVSNFQLDSWIYFVSQPIINFTAFSDYSGIDNYEIYLADNANFNDSYLFISSNNSFQPVQVLADGEWYIRVRAIDKVGNQSDFSETTFYIEAETPLKPVILMPTTQTNYSTSVLTITLSGTNTTGVDVVLKLNNDTIYIDTDKNTNWSYEINLLGNETNVIEVYAKKIIRESVITILNIYADTMVPVVSEFSINREKYFEKQPEINFTNFTDYSGIKEYEIYLADNINFNNPQIIKSSTNIFIPINELTDGEWYIKVRAFDNVDNVSEFSEIKSFVIEYVAKPDTPIFIFPTNNLVFNTNPITIRGEVNSINKFDTVNIYLNSNLIGSVIAEENGKFSYEYLFTNDGTYILTAEVVDTYSNLKSGIAIITIKLDTSAPIYTSFKIANVYDTTPIIDFPDFNDVNSVKYFVNICPLPTFEENITYKYQTEWNSSVIEVSDELIYGMYFISIQAIDEAGNYSSIFNDTFYVSDPATANYDTFVRVNEVYCAKCADYQKEFIELYNASEFDVSLNGWTLKVKTTTDTLTGVIKAKGYYVIKANRSGTAFETYWGRNPDFYGSFTLSTNTTFELKNGQGVLIQAVTGSTLQSERNWYWDDATNQWKYYSDGSMGTPWLANDITPPGTINDLACTTGINSGEIELSFKEVSDDSGNANSGKVAKYILKYSATNITDMTSFYNATTYTDTIPIVWYGVIVRLTIKNLVAGKTYYFAVVAVDDAGNTSALSNVVSCSAGGVGDTIPPSAITDLKAITGFNEGEIYIEWTNSGDNGYEGKAEALEIRYSTNEINEQNYTNATIVIDAPIPLESGKKQSFVIGGLTPNQTYYIAMKIIDAFPNYSGLSNVVVGVAKSGIDDIAPAGINDLEFVENNDTMGCVILKFTAVGDNENTGTASKYKIRYSKIPITEETFDSAVEYINNFIPQPAGEKEELNLSNLPYGETFYFAIKVEDKIGNISVLSNVVLCTASIENTAPQPPDNITAQSGYRYGEIIINFKAPYDDKPTERVQKYLLKYSLFPITETNWDFADTYLIEEITPKNYNEEERIYIYGFEPGTYYYFALRSVDEIGNLSAVSGNVIAEGSSFAVLINEIAGQPFKSDPTHPTYAVYEFIELYNTSNNDVDLTGWTLVINDAASDYQAIIPLTGKISANDYYVIANSENDFISFFGFRPDFAFNFSLNGDEYFQLKNNLGQVVDSVFSLTDNYSYDRNFYLPLSKQNARDNDYTTNWLAYPSTSIFKYGSPKAPNEKTGDDTAPAAVSDLIAEPGDRIGTIRLRWTAVGDDVNEGKAFKYNLRYSTYYIFENTFDYCYEIENEPVPSVSGVIDSMIISMPSLNTKYYFALKTLDESFNISGLSNIASSFPLPDTIPPDKVNDLSSQTGFESGQIIISFTNPFDTGIDDALDTLIILYNSEEINDTNYNSAVKINPAYSFKGNFGVKTELLLENLPAGESIYVAIQTADKSGNISAISNNVNVKVSAESDTTPPAKITDLRAVYGPVSNSIKLLWTAVGNNLNFGIADTYIIKYSQSLITENNFNNANSYYPENFVILAAGEQMSVVIPNLTANQTYYFAIKAIDKNGNISEISNVVSAVPTTLNLYYGLLHAHSSFSDGVGSPDYAFAYSRDTAGLSFFAITDHTRNNNNLPDLNGAMSEAQYQNLLNIAASFTEEGKFIAIAGQEWNAISKGGHINIYEANARCDVNNGDWDYLYNVWLKQHPEVQLLQFNHPSIGEFGDTYVSYYNDTLTLCEVTEANVSYSGTDNKGTYSDKLEAYLYLLNRGWRIAPTMNEDNHNSNWGKQTTLITGVYAASLTKTNLFEALRSRRVFSSTDRNLKLFYKVNNYDMGQVLKDQTNAQIEIDVSDADDIISYIEIYKDKVGGSLPTVYKTIYVNSSSYKDTIIDTAFDGVSYYLIKVIEQDGDYAIGAPVWIENPTSITDTLSIRPIADIRGVDANGVPLMNGQMVTISGVVTVATGNYSKTSNVVYIQDATGGINIYEENKQTFYVEEGDSVIVTGIISHFYGLLEIINPVVTMIAKNQPLPEPLVLTTYQVTRYGELYEGQLIRVNNVKIVDGKSFPSATSGKGATIMIDDGSGTTYLQIDDDVDICGKPTPNGAFSVIGVLEQIDLENGAPYTSGYRIKPRRYSDLLSGFENSETYVIKVDEDTKIIKGNLQIEIPEAVVSGKDTITMQISEVSQPPAAPALHKIIGTVYNIKIIDSVPLDKEVIIYLSYNPSILPAGTSEDSIIPYYYDDSIESYFVIAKEKYQVDKINKRVKIWTQHFSYYANMIPTSIISIADAKIDLNNDGILDLTGKSITVEGIVTAGVNTFDNSKLNIYIQDDKAGINIYKNSIDTDILEGYKIRVSGTLTQYKGLTQITNPTIEVLSTQETVPAAIKLNAKQLEEAEAYECKLVELVINDTLQLYNYYSDKIMKVEDVNANYFIYLDNNAGINPDIIKTQKTIKGILYQNNQIKYAISNVGVEYFIMPRSNSDINPMPVIANSNDYSVKINNNPFCPELNQQLEIEYAGGVNVPLEIKVFNIEGRLVRDLFNGSVSGSGKILWDGKKNNGNIADIGIYILYINFNNKKITRPVSVAVPMR